MFQDSACVFEAKGRLKLSTITDTMVERITEARPTYIFLAIGGNDTSIISDLEKVLDETCN